MNIRVHWRTVLWSQAWYLAFVLSAHPTPGQTLWVAIIIGAVSPVWFERIAERER